jgi:hypothetical protein
VHLLHGDPDGPPVRHALAEAIARRLPDRPKLGDRGHRADTDDVQTRVTWLRGRRIRVVGDPSPGFVPSEYDASLLRRLFGVSIETVDVLEAFAWVRAVSERAVSEEQSAALAAQPTLMGSGPPCLFVPVDLDAERSVVWLGHCGSAATTFAADPSNALRPVLGSRRSLPEPNRFHGNTADGHLQTATQDFLHRARDRRFSTPPDCCVGRRPGPNKW